VLDTLAPPEPFTCPRCGAVSHNPTDARYLYCGRGCHTFPGQRETLATAEADLFREHRIVVDLLAHAPGAVRFLRDLVRDNGFLAGKLLPGNRYSAIAPMGFTTALIVGQVGDTVGCSQRYCYHGEVPALAALLLWTGEGEPTGWHRALDGRRVAQGPDEYDEHGNLVPPGQVYVRG